jgi:hypothetical protein
MDLTGLSEGLSGTELVGFEIAIMVGYEGWHMEMVDMEDDLAYHAS